MNEHTPTTEDVRNYFSNTGFQWMTSDEASKAFDRWLAEVKAEAWEEGEGAGVDNQYAWDGWRYKKGYPIKNPYRKGEN